METTKVCFKCRESKILSNFAKSSSSKDGHYCYCRPCASLHSKQYREKARLKVLEKVPDEKKVCRNCKETKDKVDFYKKSNSRDGLQAYCKNCTKATKKKHVEDMKERETPPLSTILEGTKTCSKCKEERSKTEFHRSSRSKDFLNSACKQCVREAYEEIRLFILEKKRDLGGKCVQCGFDDIRILQFDHLRDKFKSVSLLRSKETIEKEVSKCQLLCPFCHYIKSNNEFTRYEEVEYKDMKELRLRNIAYVNSVKLAIGHCQFCKRVVKDSNYPAFHFDHIDPATKIEGISRLATGVNSSIERLDREIRKCRLLCANCHMMHTLEQFGYLDYYHKMAGHYLTIM